MILILHMVELVEPSRSTDLMTIGIKCDALCLPLAAIRRRPMIQLPILMSFVPILVDWNRACHLCRECIKRWFAIALTVVTRTVRGLAASIPVSTVSMTVVWHTLRSGYSNESKRGKDA